MQIHSHNSEAKYRKTDVIYSSSQLWSHTPTLSQKALPPHSSPGPHSGLASHKYLYLKKYLEKKNVSCWEKSWLHRTTSCPHFLIKVFICPRVTCAHADQSSKCGTLTKLGNPLYCLTEIQLKLSRTHQKLCKLFKTLSEMDWYCLD